MLDFTKEFKEIKIFSAVFWYIFTMFIVILFAIISDNDKLFYNDNMLSLISSTLFIFVLLYKFRVCKNKLILLINDYFSKINIKEIGEIVITQLIISMGISLLSIGIAYFIFPELLNELLNDSPISEASTYGGVFISMLVTVICAPLSEELLFRSIIFKRISRKLNIYIGMVISSVIFGILHIELAIIGAFIFGLVCCILYVKYKNILIPMTVHFFNNLVAFLPELDISASSQSSTITSSDASSFLIMGSLLFLIGMFFFIRFMIKNKNYLKSGFAPRIEEQLIKKN